MITHLHFLPPDLALEKRALELYICTFFVR